jgi:hypothetical protein
MPATMSPGGHSFASTPVQSAKSARALYQATALQTGDSIPLPPDHGRFNY